MGKIHQQCTSNIKACKIQWWVGFDSLGSFPVMEKWQQVQSQWLWLLLGGRAAAAVPLSLCLSLSLSAPMNQNTTAIIFAVFLRARKKLWSVYECVRFFIFSWGEKVSRISLFYISFRAHDFRQSRGEILSASRFSLFTKLPSWPIVLLLILFFIT